RGAHIKPAHFMEDRLHHEARFRKAFLDAEHKHHGPDHSQTENEKQQNIKFLQYELVPDGNNFFLVVKSMGCEASVMEEVEIKDLTSGEMTPITVWVEVLK
ncbi:MAG: hypothetical protein AABZ60_16890, partial [Planctomycetota bacterium]